MPDEPTAPIRVRTLDQICREICPLGFPIEVAQSLWYRQLGRNDEADEMFAIYLNEEEQKRRELAEQRAAEYAAIQEKMVESEGSE